MSSMCAEDGFRGKTLEFGMSVIVLTDEDNQIQLN